MSFVLDSSIAFAWVYSEETSADVQRVFDLLVEDFAWVPSHWRLEVANVLEIGLRKGRSDGSFRDAALADLALLPIQSDLETDRQAWGATRQLAEKHRLSLYAAAYLELALRRNLPLATLDSDLWAAAGLEDVSVLG